MMIHDSYPCHKENYTKGRTSSIRYLVIHYTGNKGDTAKNNASYFSSSVVGVSAHYFVDENEVYQSVADEDKAWHCGRKDGKYKHPECRNDNSIGIEICMWDREGVVRQGSIDQAAVLARNLMDKYGIDAAHVVRHYDVTDKACPAPFVDEPARWTAFRMQLDSGMTPEPAGAADVLAVAAAELGVEEAPVGSNNVKYNTAYYDRAVSGKDYSWCVTFLWWVFKRAEASNLFYGGEKTASSTTLYNYYKRQGQEVELGDIRPGDLVFFNFEGTTGMTHTAICESTETVVEGEKQVTYVRTIDGNTGSITVGEGDSQVTVSGYAVLRRRRKLFDSYVKGAARPNYANGEEGEMTAEQFKQLYDQIDPLYTSLQEVPAYWREDVEELISSGAIIGDKASPIHIHYSGLQAAIIAKRYHNARTRSKYLDWDPDYQSTHLGDTGVSIKKYLMGDRSGDDFVAEHGKGLRFVTGTLKVGEDGQTPLSRQLVNSYGQSLYWQKDVSGAELREGVPYLDGERVYTTVEATDWPVMVYQYDLQDKMGLSFQQDEDTRDEVPVVTLGAGTGAGKRGKGFLYKGPDGLHLDYYSREDEQLRRITIGDKGIALTPYGLGQLDVFPNGFSAVYSGEKVAYKWELNADGTIRRLVGEDGTAVPVTWHEEET